MAHMIDVECPQEFSFISCGLRIQSVIITVILAGYG